MRLMAVIQDSSLEAKHPEKPTTQSSDSGIATGTGDDVTPGTGKQSLGPIPIPFKGTSTSERKTSPQNEIP